MTTVFERNLALLENLDVLLADRMRGLSWPPPGVTVLEARNGTPTARFPAFDGKEVAVHSEYDPAKEAKQLLDSSWSDKQDLYVLYGFGLGYSALEIVKRLHSKAWLFCVETEERLFRAAMEVVDLSPVLSGNRVFFSVGRDWVKLRADLRLCLSAIDPMSLAEISIPSSRRLFPQFYTAASREVDEAFRERQINFNTLAKYVDQIEQNSLRNLTLFARCHGIQDFERVFKGVPAIVVGAGPSLDDAMPLLRRAKGRALIVVVGRTLRKLLKAGVVPDFVATLDMQEEVALFLQGFEIPKEIVHLIDPDCHYKAAGMFPGATVTCDIHSNLGRWLKPFHDGKGSMNVGGSVIHTSFTFAQFCGASPIILVGADMSFPRPNGYAQGTELKGFDPDFVDEEWITIPGAAGEPVRSLPAYASFISLFEVAISTERVQVVQSSRIGAMIRGAEHISLEEAFERYLTREIPVAERIRDVLSRPVRFDGEAFDEESDAVLSELSELGKTADEGFKVAEKLRSLDASRTGDRERFGKAMKQANTLRNRILWMRRAKALLGRLCSPTHYRVRTLTREAAELRPDASERLEKAAEQLAVFFSGYRDAARLYAEELRGAQRRLVRETGTP